MSRITVLNNEIDEITFWYLCHLRDCRAIGKEHRTPLNAVEVLALCALESLGSKAAGAHLDSEAL